jgi:putative copper export protein
MPADECRSFHPIIAGKLVYQFVLITHLLAATLWTGGHLLLALGFLPAALRERDVALIERFEQRFEPIGLPALGIQVVSGLWLANVVQPDWSRWIGFSGPASSLVLVKLLLLFLTFALAVHARFKLIPQLSAATLPALAWHIRGVTLLSVLFVVVGVGLRTRGF